MNTHNDWQYYLINDEVEFWPTINKLVSRQNRQEFSLFSPASACLLELITHQPDIVTQAELIKKGWGEERNAFVTTNAFYQCILILRRTLKEAGLAHDIIRTIPRRGLKIPKHVAVSIHENEEVHKQLAESVSGLEKNEQNSNLIWDDLPSESSLVHTSMSHSVEVNESIDDVSGNESLTNSDLVNKSKTQFFLKNINYYSVLLFLMLIFFSGYLISSAIEEINSHDVFSTYKKAPITKDGCTFYFNKSAIIYKKHNEFVKSTAFDCSQLDKIFVTAYLYSPQVSAIQCHFSNELPPQKYCISKYYPAYEK